MKHWTTIKKLNNPIFSPSKTETNKLIELLGENYGETTEISYRKILDLMGFWYAVRAIKADFSENRDLDARLLACDYAENVAHLCGSEFSPKHVIDFARIFAYIKPDKEEIDALETCRKWAMNLWVHYSFQNNNTKVSAFSAVASSANSDAISAVFSSARDARYAKNTVTKDNFQEERFLHYFGE